MDDPIKAVMALADELAACRAAIALEGGGLTAYQAARSALESKLRELIPVWRPISEAPKDGTVVLVNDTTPGWSAFTAASWCPGDEWSGWVYDDPVSGDNNPLGPNPTHYMPIQPAPKEGS